MDDDMAARLMPLVPKILAGEPVSFSFGDDEITPESHYYLYESDGKVLQTLDRAPEGSLSVAHYSGVVMKETYCGMQGTADLMQTMKSSDSDPNVSGHLLVLDSGGGAVDGTFEFASAMNQLSKPVTVYVDGTCCSGAYAMAMNGHKIIASSKTATIGSIGVMTTFRDTAKKLEAQGVEQRDIYSETSPDKNSAYRAALEGDDGPMQERLTEIDAIFMSEAKAARPGITEKALLGGTFLAESAKEHGLIDEIGSFEEAANYALDISNQLKVK